MSQASLAFANTGFPAARVAINDALAAAATMSSGPAAPATPLADQMWFETDTGILHKRNSTNTEWVALLKISSSGVDGLLGAAPFVTAASALNNLDAGLMRVAVAAGNVATVGGPSGAGAGLVEQHQYGSTNRVQVYSQVTDPARQWVRYLASGTWSAWREIYNAVTINGTVSMSGGIATGAVMERGSNSNGEYVRFANGLQLCWDTGETTVAISTAQGSLFIRASTIARTFAMPFLSGTIPTVTTTAGRLDGGTLVWATISAKQTVTGFEMQMLSAESLSTSVTKFWNYTAQGRWA